MSKANTKTKLDNTFSGTDWFWKNYDTCLQWQERHVTAYWKSKALALEYERNALLQYIETTFEPHYANGPSASKMRGSGRSSPRNGHGGKGYKFKKRSRANGRNRVQSSPQSYRHDEHRPVKEDNDSNYPNYEEINLDNDIVEFFKQSMRHKMELKKRRKESEESDSTDSSNFNKKPFSSQRNEEMQLLYGKNSPMIQGMETAMQLTFERNCDLLNPVLWPILPLKM